MIGRMRFLPRTSLALAAYLGVACAGSNFDGRVYHQGEIHVRFDEVPSEWRQIDVTDTALAFRDDAASSTILFNGRCGKDASDVPLASLRQHLFLHFTERQIDAEELIGLDGREALVTHLVAKLDGVLKHFVVVIIKKDGCVYDMIRVAPRAGDDPGFTRFYRGFSTID